MPMSKRVLALLCSLVIACGPFFGCGSDADFTVEVYLHVDPQFASRYYQPGNVYSIFFYDTPNDNLPIYDLDFNGTKPVTITVPRQLQDVPLWVRVVVSSGGGFLFDGAAGNPASPNLLLGIGTPISINLLPLQ